MSIHGYKEKVTDDELITLIESEVMGSSSDWLNNSDLSRERQKSTYEYAGIAAGHLAPQGVSTIVDTSTTEVVEAYTSILCDLFLNNQKLARFVPLDDSPGAFREAHDAATLVNHAIFKQNRGWEILESWIKSSLLWKNSVIRWDFIEDCEYTIEEYDRIDQVKLDELLADDSIEIIGDLQFENEFADVDPIAAFEGGQGGEPTLVYVDVRLRRKVDKSRVKIENIPPESFRIARDARGIEDAAFVGIQTEMSRSEIRKQWPDIADEIGDDEWDDLSSTGMWSSNGDYSLDEATRKFVTGQNYTGERNTGDNFGLEANREVTVTECWVRVDRDGDGIAELKHIIVAGSHILHEVDVDEVPIASLCPINIPHEFYGLSMADFTRSSTLASTAILRGFVENTYLTNYSPKLADPNVVDFSALQNMKPKQIIATNGNPAAAVQAMVPETISTGTVPLLEHIQMIKEQATGMSKAAQGLNDTLYVSGNSEQKLAAVQSASQKRIQHIARRFAETGFKRLCNGIYHTMRKCMQVEVSCFQGNVFKKIDPSKLPRNLDCDVFIDIGENSNANKIQKLKSIGMEILPQLKQQGAGSVIKPEAAAILASQLLEAMAMDSNDYLHDYTTDEFKQEAQAAIEEQGKMQQQQAQMEQRKLAADVGLQEANVAFTQAQAKNTADDNARQMAIAIDKHFQEWSDLQIKATKEGAQVAQHPDFNQILEMVKGIMGGQGNAPQGQPQRPQGPKPNMPKR